MKKISKPLTFILFFAGILLGLTLALFSMWADFEANFYGFSRQTSNPLSGLSCPIMMTASESKNISIKVTNTTDRHLSPNVRIEISTPLTLSESFDYIDLAPGESATLKKPIGAENIDLDKFIFVDVLVYSAYPMANQESMCGVFILPFGTNGAAILTTGTILSLLLIACGVYFLRKLELRKTILTPLLVIAFLILPALAFSFLGWWLQTILVLVVFILMLGIVIGNFVAQ